MAEGGTGPHGQVTVTFDENRRVPAAVVCDGADLWLASIIAQSASVEIIYDSKHDLPYTAMLPAVCGKLIQFMNFNLLLIIFSGTSKAWSGISEQTLIYKY